MIDWADPEFMISQHFKVREVLLLPQWNRLAAEADGVTDDAKKALVSLFEKMDAVRDFIGLPIVVHCAFRSPDYNKLVHGAPDSCHIARIENGAMLAAVDWHAVVIGETQGGGCDTLRSSLEPKLEEWGMRMENNGYGAAWIHLDTKPIGSGSRYFKP